MKYTVIIYWFPACWPIAIHGFFTKDEAFKWANEQFKTTDNRFYGYVIEDENGNIIEFKSKEC